MDWGLIANIVLAIATVIVSVLAFRRMAPKRQLEWWLESRQMVTSSGQDQIKDLEVRVQGIVVPNPYMNSISLYSNSRVDIPSTDFDSGEPIVIEITEGGAVQIQESGSIHEIKIARGSGEGFEWAKFGIAPQLIRRRAKATLAFVSSGAPTVSIQSSLVNVNIRRVPVTGQYVIPGSVHPPRWFTLLLIFGSAVAIGLIVGIVIWLTTLWK